MPRKGRIEPGADADLALVDLAAEYTLRAEDLHYRHRISPYIGRRLRGARRPHAAARRRTPRRAPAAC